MSKILYHSMKIRDLSLKVKLGCSVEERMTPQELRVNIELRFTKIPMGTNSDNLKDTICYAQLIKAIKKHIENKEFQLIEKIAKQLHKIIQKTVKGHAKSSVSVHKIKPPVAGLLGGVEFRIGEFQ